MDLKKAIKLSDLVPKRGSSTPKRDAAPPRRKRKHAPAEIVGLKIGATGIRAALVANNGASGSPSVGQAFSVSASLFDLPTMVERPMSRLVIEIGAPTLDLLAESSENDRHSGPWSIDFSLMTKPQLLQDTSPVPESSTRPLLPQFGHLSDTWSPIVLCECGILIAKFSDGMVYKPSSILLLT